jgi:hypothetical protein
MITDLARAVLLACLIVCSAVCSAAGERQSSPTAAEQDDKRTYAVCKAATVGPYLQTIGTGTTKEPIVDGVTLSSGDIVLVKSEQDVSKNGIYQVNYDGQKHTWSLTSIMPSANSASVADGATNKDSLWFVPAVGSHSWFRATAKALAPHQDPATFAACAAATVGPYLQSLGDGSVKDLIVDGVELSAGNWVLIKDEPDTSKNGVYFVFEDKSTKIFTLRPYSQTFSRASIDGGNENKHSWWFLPTPSSHLWTEASVTGPCLYIESTSDTGTLSARWVPSRPHFRRGELTAIRVYYPADKYQISVSGQDVNYATTPTTGPGLATAVELAPAIFVLRPMGDDCAISVQLTAYSSSLTDSSKTPQLPPYTYNDTLPVDFGLAQSLKICFSAGLLLSDLQDQSLQLVTTTNLTGTQTKVENGRNTGSETIKGIEERGLSHRALHRSSRGIKFRNGLLYRDKFYRWKAGSTCPFSWG